MHPVTYVGETFLLYTKGRRTLEMDTVGFFTTLIINTRLDITSQKTATWPCEL
jgi:hypothetical protein